MNKHMYRLGWIALIGATCVLPACGNDNDTNVGTGGPTTNPMATNVDVTVGNFFVRPAMSTALEGAITFRVYNGGTETHEFVVVKTDLTAEQLPVNADGSFNEEGAGVQVIDEIDAVAPGSTEQLSVNLDTGHYILLCNRVETEANGEVVSHFQHGMHADFTVASRTGVTP
jgi:hypothetical protein